MIVQFDQVAFTEEPTVPLTVEMDWVPRVGEIVEIPGLPEGEVYVRTVVHHPYGNPEADPPDPTPFVYVVVGRSRNYG